LKWYIGLAVVILVVLEISTSVPDSGSQLNFRVYSSMDPFVPISGILLWVIAGGEYWFGKRKEKKP